MHGNMIINYLITSIEANHDRDVTISPQSKMLTNIAVTNVEKDDQSKILKISLKFDASFEGNESKNLGKIMIKSLIVYMGDNLDKIYKTWEDKKQLDESVTEEILQAGLNMNFLEAMSISKMLQLPSLLPLPRLQKSSQTTEEPKHDKKKK